MASVGLNAQSSHQPEHNSVCRFLFLFYCKFICSKIKPLFRDTRMEVAGQGQMDPPERLREDALCGTIVPQPLIRNAKSGRLGLVSFLSLD